MTSGASLAQSAEDLGSQPINPPSAADLGVAPPPREPKVGEDGKKGDGKKEGDAKKGEPAPPSPAPTPKPPPAPTSTPAPAPSPAPTPPPAAPTPPPAASTAPPAAKAAIPDAAAEKAAAHVAMLRTALYDLDESDAKAALQRLDAAAGAWVPDGVTAAAPAIKPLIRMLRARTAIVQGRSDDAETHLRDAGTTLDAASGLAAPEARHLREGIRFLRAAAAEARARPKIFTAGCGKGLGLRRLARDEANARQSLIDDVAGRYVAVARGGDRFWARRAAFASARLSEDLARLVLSAPSYRAITLPPPFGVSGVDTKDVVAPTLRDWVGGLRRAYTEIDAAITARDPDPALREQIAQQIEKLQNFDTFTVAEPIANPWHPDVHAGLFRMSRRAERADADGNFVPVETRLAVEAMTEALTKNEGTVDAAFALAGLAMLRPDGVPLEPVLQALSSSEPRVVTAGLIAVERLVKGKTGVERAKKLTEAVVAATSAAIAADAAARPGREYFSALQDSLYHPVERGLLALLSIVRVDRTALDVIAADDRIPVVERAWLAAEVADSRLAQRYDSWAWDRDERVAALAVWGGVTARGRKFAGYLLRPGDNGLVGCVSRTFD
jgi:hypothetical protein